MPKSSEFITIEEDVGEGKKAYSFSDFGETGWTKKERERRTTTHYLFTNIFSAAMILTFLGLIVLQVEIPEYFIGMIGAVLGYYLSKKPFE